MKCTTHQTLAREVHIKYKRGDNPTSLITLLAQRSQKGTLGYTSSHFSGALYGPGKTDPRAQDQGGPGHRLPNRLEKQKYNCYGNRPKGRKLPTAKMTHATSSKKKYSPVCMRHSIFKNKERKTINSQKVENVGCISPKARAQRKDYKIIKQVEFGTSKTANRGLSEI